MPGPAIPLRSAASPALRQRQTRPKRARNLTNKPTPIAPRHRRTTKPNSSTINRLPIAGALSLTGPASIFPPMHGIARHDHRACRFAPGIISLERYFATSAQHKSFHTITCVPPTRNKKLSSSVTRSHSSFRKNEKSRAFFSHFCDYVSILPHRYPTAALAARGLTTRMPENCHFSKSWHALCICMARRR